MAFVMVVSSVSANHTGGVEGYVSCKKGVEQRITQWQSHAARQCNPSAYRDIGVDVVAPAIGARANKATGELVHGGRHHLEALVALGENLLHRLDLQL